MVCRADVCLLVQQYNAFGDGQYKWVTPVAQVSRESLSRDKVPPYTLKNKDFPVYPFGQIPVGGIVTTTIILDGDSFYDFEFTHRSCL